MTRRACLGIAAPLVTGCTRREVVATVRMLTFIGAPYQSLVERLGFFKKHGIDVRLEQIGSSSKMSQALIGGSADVIYNAFDQVLQLVSSGRQLAMFYTLFRVSLGGVYASARSARHIRTVKDLRGAVIGISGFGSSTEYRLVALLERHGLKKSDVQLVAIGSAPALITALETGKVDAASVGTVVVKAYERKYPEAAVLLDASDPEKLRTGLGINSYPVGLVAQTSWLRANRDAALRLVRAQNSAAEWVQAHTPLEIREATPQDQRSADPNADIDLWTYVKSQTVPGGRIPPKGPENVRDVVAVSLPKVRDVDLSTTWTNEFVEESAR
jgi:NitT/TauT family transport system substrate-binding protein